VVVGVGGRVVDVVVGGNGGGGAIPGSRESPNAHPSTEPAFGLYDPAPEEEYLHVPPRLACQ
jgi:hypothetical protein